MGGTPSKPVTIFRITHIKNVPWLLKHGLRCPNSKRQDDGFHRIGNPELIEKRHHRAVPIDPFGTLSDYVPFYFTPYSPMLYNIKTGYGGITQIPMHDIAIFATSLQQISEMEIPFVFTDRHAYLKTAEFYDDLSDLSHIDWKLLRSRDFKRDPNDPGKLERYQAEALISGKVPISALQSVSCYSTKQVDFLEEAVDTAGVELVVQAKPGWFF